MQTAPEVVRAAMAHLDTMARAYADALVAHAQAGGVNAPRDVYNALLNAHARLGEAAGHVARLP